MRAEAGSALLLAVFMCLACAALCLALTGLIRLAQDVRLSELAGENVQSRAQDGLVRARDACLQAWGPITLRDDDGVNVQTSELDPQEPNRLEATAVVPAGGDGVREYAGLVVRALLERGLDGPTLPFAALVATTCTMSSPREAAPVRPTGVAGGITSGSDPGRGVVPVFLCAPEPLADVTCAIVQRMSTPWRLDEGTALWLASCRGVSGAITILEGRPGTRLQLPTMPSIITGSEPYDGGGPSGGEMEPSPQLIVALGGADLSLERLGHLRAVVIVDGGSLLLEGTEVQGAAFVGGIVHFGQTGALVFDPAALRWATDGSLPRVRLVPGSRRESWEGEPG